MTTLHERTSQNTQATETKTGFKIAVDSNGAERREFRRHDLETAGIPVERYEGSKRAGKEFGRLVDLSAGGVRIRTSQTNVKADGQIRLRLALPDYAGICPFVDTTGTAPTPKKEWVGWMSIARVKQTSKNECEVAGRLVDMDEMDRGMLGLYLSTQPLAA